MNNLIVLVQVNVTSVACIQLQMLPQGIELSKRSQGNGAGGRESATNKQVTREKNDILKRWR